MVRRKKTTIFLDAKENTTVYDLKKMVEGITKVPPENQELYKDDEVYFPGFSLSLKTPQNTFNLKSFRSL